MNKKELSFPLRYKLHSIIHKDYKLIRRFKKTTELLHDSQVDLSEKN